ncbi:MAG: PAS domain S-box protein, partial [Haloarculaceae archaeon]
MSDAVGPTRGGFLVGVVGASLFVASIAQKAVSIVDLYDLAQMVYVAAAALVVAAIGGWTIYDAWSPAEQRRVLVWTLLGGSFLLVLALLATVDLQLGDAVGVVDREFFLLHFVTLGCLGGSTVGLYAVRTGQSTRRAAAERNRSEAVVRQSPLPITVVDMDGTVIRWNEAAEDVFGYDADEVRGEPSPLVPADGKAEYREHLDRLRGGDDIEGVRTKRQCRDGTLLDVELWGTPVSDPASGEIYAVFLARDLTEIDLLEERRTVLERVLRHNLRNELTVIRG